MEKLCQAFENGKELVELSQASPHDISNVLKLYLRQVRGRGCLLRGGGGGGRNDLPSTERGSTEPALAGGTVPELG